MSSAYPHPVPSRPFLLQPERREAPERRGPSEQPRGGVLACIKDMAAGAEVAKHAFAIAQPLGLPVTLARVVEAPPRGETPADAIEWHMRRTECQKCLETIAASHLEQRPRQLESVLLAGSVADELARWSDDHEVALAVLATRKPQPGIQGLGTTAHRVLHTCPASLLLVPPNATSSDPVCYRRLLVPLDGSPRAESVLPLAIRLARAHGAEMILAHAVPDVETVDRFETGEARSLSLRLQDHAERLARTYLDGIRRQLEHELGAVRVRVCRGDPRILLRRVAIDQGVDLIILSSHGHSGMSDVAVGSVADYLAGHASAPLLIVRPGFAHALGSAGNAERVRAAPEAAPTS
jgi:nucleotide-binding universal stress UspA family protein